MSLSTTENGPEAALHGGLPQPQRFYAFVTLGAAVMLSVLDASMMNVALPSIAAAQGVSPSAAIWVVTAFQLAVVACLLPMASLAEAIGFRKIYFAGVALVGAASLFCAMADSIATLIAARAVQGIGAGAIMSINGAMVRHIVPADGIGRGIATISLVVGISAAAGPTVAGAILSVASWHWLFLVNVPICLGILLSGALTLPRIAGRGNRFDVVSAVLNALAFGLAIYALSGFGRGGSALLSTLELGAAALAFAALVRRQRRMTSPLLPTDLLSHRPFALSVSASITSFAAQFLALVSLPFYLHDVLGRSPAETGLLLTPWPIAVAALAPIAGRLADRPYRAIQSVAGMGLVALGLLLIAALPADPSNADIMWRLALCGAGFSLFQAPNSRTIMTSAPLDRSGGASGMMSVARVFGQSCGAALAASLIAVLGGFQIVPLMAVAAAFALCAAALGGLRNANAM